MYPSVGGYAVHRQLCKYSVCRSFGDGILLSLCGEHALISPACFPTKSYRSHGVRRFSAAFHHLSLIFGEIGGRFPLQKRTKFPFPIRRVRQLRRNTQPMAAHSIGFPCCVFFYPFLHWDKAKQRACRLRFADSKPFEQLEQRLSHISWSLQPPYNRIITFRSTRNAYSPSCCSTYRPKQSRTC